MTYTPTLEAVRERYSWDRVQDEGGPTEAEARAEFDRLIAAHDAQVREGCAKIAESLNRPMTRYREAGAAIAAAIRANPGRERDSLDALAVKLGYEDAPDWGGHAEANRALMADWAERHGYVLRANTGERVQGDAKLLQNPANTGEQKESENDNPTGDN